MANLPLFVSNHAVIYDLAGNRLGSSLPLIDVADYLGSIDVNLKTGTYIQFREVAYTLNYNCYRFMSGVLYAAPDGNPLCGGTCINC